MSLIDWARVAKPQDDGYDVWALNVLDSEHGWYHHTPPADAVTLCEGHIWVRPIPDHTVSMSNAISAFEAPGDIITQEWADYQTSFLNKWPAGYNFIKHFLDEFWPHYQNDWHPSARGSSSGHYLNVRDRHCIFITMNDPQGCAEGIYHEAGHLKLISCGIKMESHDFKLLRNEPTELYDSPVRYDCKRPMSAVLHGLYSWILFAENDYHIYKAAPAFRHAEQKELFYKYNHHNLPKIQNGVEEVRKYAKLTPDGIKFLDSLFAWSDDLLTRCYAAHEGS